MQKPLFARTVIAFALLPLTWACTPSGTGDSSSSTSSGAVASGSSSGGGVSTSGNSSRPRSSSAPASGISGDPSSSAGEPSSGAGSSSSSVDASSQGSSAGSASSTETASSSQGVSSVDGASSAPAGGSSSTDGTSSSSTTTSGGSGPVDSSSTVGDSSSAAGASSSAAGGGSSAAGGGSSAAGGSSSVAAGSSSAAGNSSSAVPVTYSVGGSLVGLITDGLVLASGSSTLARSSTDTTFAFGGFASGSTYSITVQTQPLGLECTVENGTGQVGTADVSSVRVACVALTYAVSGTVEGLVSAGLVLSNNAADLTTVPSLATSFQFVTPVAFGAAYDVEVLEQPTGANCLVANGSGTVGAGPVNDIEVVCSLSTYVLRGTVTGLTTGTLELGNGADRTTVAEGGTTFEFTTRVPHLQPYNVLAVTPPAGASCTVTNGSGTVQAADVTNVGVACTYPLSVVSSVPTEGDQEVSAGTTSVSLTFNRAAATSVTSVSLVPGVGGTPVALSGTWNADATVLTLALPTGLTRGLSYALLVSDAGFASAAGGVLNGTPYLVDGVLDFSAVPAHSEPILDVNALGTLTGDTWRLAHTPTTEPVNDTGGTCVSEAAGAGGDVLFRYTAGRALLGLTLSSAQSTINNGDTVLYAYPDGPGTELRCNDDVGGGVATSLVTISRCIQNNETLYVALDTYLGAGNPGTWGTGQGVLSVTELPIVGPTIVAPADGAINVAINAPLLVDFPAAMDTTLGTVTFTAGSDIRTVNVAAPGSGVTVTWSNGDRRLSVVFSAPFALSATVAAATSGFVVANCNGTGLPNATSSFTIRSTPPPAPLVSTINVTGLPTGFRPGWGLTRIGDNLAFTITNSTGLASRGSQRGGIGQVPLAGGAYTPLFTHNQATSALDPQTVWVRNDSNGVSRLFAFNGIFSSPLGTAGVYQVADLTTATPKAQGAPLGSGDKYGWSVNRGNFFLAQYVPAPYDILGANVEVAAPTTFTNVTNAGTFAGPYGVAASNLRAYVFDATDATATTPAILSYPLSTVADPAVPVVNGPPDTLNVYGTACRIQSRTAAVFNAETNPTRLYYATWTTGTNPGAGDAVNRICVLQLEAATGSPVGVATVYAGPNSGPATGGDVDADTETGATAARFRNITALFHDNATGDLYVLQRANTTNPAGLIRRVHLH